MKTITFKYSDDDKTITFSDGEVSDVDYDGEFKYKGKWFDTTEAEGPKDIENMLAKEFSGIKFIQTETKMTKMNLRQMIRESVRRILKESTASVRDFLNTPSDPPNESMIRLILERKIAGNTAVYRLENDNWFRRYEGFTRGYGLMIRNIRISPNPIKITRSWAIGDFHSVFKCIVTYLPNGFDSAEDDIPQNYETAQGLIVLGTKHFTGFEMQQVLSVKDIENFVKSNISNYVP
jgi:hypothetical protein